MITWFEQLTGLIVLIASAFLLGLALGGAVNE